MPCGTALRSPSRGPAPQGDRARSAGRPDGPGHLHIAAGYIEVLGRNFDGGREQFRRALEMEPSFEVAHWMTMLSYVSENRPEEARAELAKLASWPRTGVVAYSGVIDALAGRREEALQAAREIEELSRNGYVPPSAPAIIQVALGDKDKAFPLLFKGCAEQDGYLLLLRDDAFYDGLRSDPRWPDLLRCMNLE